jgi:hypothetical protein
MTPAQKAKYVPVQTGGYALIDGIDKLEQMAQDYRDGKMSFFDFRSGYDAAREGLMTAFKTYDNTGARIEESEKARFEHLIPTVNAVQLHLTDLKHSKMGMHESRQTIVNIIRRTGDSLGLGTSKFKADDPYFRLNKGKPGAAESPQAPQSSPADDIAERLRGEQGNGGQ